MCGGNAQHAARFSRLAHGERDHGQLVVRQPEVGIEPDGLFQHLPGVGLAIVSPCFDADRRPGRRPPTRTPRRPPCAPSRRGLDVEALSHTGREVIGERQRVGASYALGEPDGAGGEILDARVDAQVGPGLIDRP